MIFAAISGNLRPICRKGSRLVARKLTLLAGLIAPSLAGGALACDGLVDGPRGTITEIVDGDTVFFDNGLQIRLIGMQAPKLPLGRDGFDTWPLADEARDYLSDLTLGQRAVLRYGGERIDRNGRSLGHLFLEDGDVWLQAELIGAGMGRVYSFADNRKCLGELLAAEARARAEGIGVWSDDYYAIRNAQNPAALLPLEGHYELVEGRVLEAGQANGRIYLNFGRLWREDFTLVIDPPAQSLFEDAGIDLLGLGGALIRARGWIEIADGPRIAVTHPEQLEFLSSR
jgi:endonuclease YncB( thermonuclease family)